MNRALKLLEESGLDKYDQGELLEMFYEDLEEYSEATAMEKLETGIADCKIPTE